MAPRLRFTPGQVLAVPLDGGRWAYGRMLAVRPNLAFHAHLSGGTDPEPDAAAAVRSPVVFVLAVDYPTAVLEYGWRRAGKVSLDVGDASIPDRYTQNVGNPDDIKIFDPLDRMRPGTREECLVRGLEPMSLWGPDHVRDRLEDYFAGRPNRWITHLE